MNFNIAAELKISLKNYVPATRYENIFPQSADARRAMAWA